VDTFWIKNISTDPQIFALPNTECPDDKYPKLKINMSELKIREL